VKVAPPFLFSASPAARAPRFGAFLRQVLMAAIIGGSLLAACSQAGEAPVSAVGTWGGDRLNLVLGPTGGRLEYDCATGSIDAPVRLDAAGRFSARGTHIPHQPGPERIDQATTPRTATYDGRVAGNVLELSVRIDGEATAHTYRLERDRTVKLLRCLL
jgi:hypothetical protein